jgi:hypothetical protein
METLGLSDSPRRSESRLKSLFWPSIESGTDVDYLAVQGFWVCTIVGVVGLISLAVARQPVTGLVVFLLFHLGGVGVREHNPFAAAMILIYFAIDTLLAGIGLLRIAIAALLVSNLRATWIADHWNPESEEAALPPRMGETLADKFSDRWPAFIWPKVKVLYYIVSFAFLALVVGGLIMKVIRGPHL